MKLIFSLINQWKLTDLAVKNIFFTDESVKRQITDSISENLTDTDLESTLGNLFKKLQLKFQDDRMKIFGVLLPVDFENMVSKKTRFKFQNVFQKLSFEVHLKNVPTHNRY